MLIDARTLPDGSEIAADLCIIGAGPAGLTIANSLARKGVRVALLESGGEDYDPEVNVLAEGEYTGIEVEPLDVTRVRALGGTSTIWNGQCRMLDPHDFEERDWVPHSGWPFPYEELAPHYARAHAAMRLEPVEYDIAVWSKQTELPYLHFGEGMGFNRVSLIRALDFWSGYASDLREAANVTVYTYANVLGIRTTDEGSAVENLDVTTLAGNHLTARARTFVLACGGIENARMLLLSNDVHTNGLGNGHDLVGRYFMEHPRFTSGTLLLSGDGLPIRNLYDVHYLHDGFSVRADLGLTAAAQARERIGNVLGRLRPADRKKLSPGGRAARNIWQDVRRGRVPVNFMGNLWQAISDLDEVAGSAYRRLYRDQHAFAETWELEIYVEQSPNPDSRVVLADVRDRFGQPKAHLIWRLTDFDRKTALRGAELFAQAMGAEGLGRVRLDITEGEVFPPSTGWGHHHMGTTRMHDDPGRGVVDGNAKVHGVENLYVAGSSVFPTAGCATPTLTIVALAFRLADHLEGLGKGVSR